MPVAIFSDLYPLLKGWPCHADPFFAELALEVGTGRLGSDGRLLRDMVAVRRSAGWVNIPLSALACRDAGGAVIEFGP